MDVGTALIYLFGLIAMLVFLSLTATAVFRPRYFSTLVEAYKVIALALVGKRYSERMKPDRMDDEDDTK